MKKVLGLALLAACADAFSLAPATSFVGSKNMAVAQKTRVSLRTSPSISMQSVAAVYAGKPLARQNPAKTITLHVYDHCPFCVRSRMIFGLKNIRYNLNFMANDDVETPTALIGKKVAPIMEIRADSFSMNESMDIVKKIDEDPTYGAPILKPASDRTDIKAWQKKHADTFRELQRPRYVVTGLLPEFAFESARETFIKNHQMPGYEKADWKSDAYTMEFRKAEYQKAFDKTPQHLGNANEALKELEPLIHSAEYCSEQGLSYDDIDLFARLRSITIIKGIVLPPKVAAYMDYFAKTADIPLYTGLAL
jgi:glutaredoxin 2